MAPLSSDSPELPPVKNPVCSEDAESLTMRFRDFEYRLGQLLVTQEYTTVRSLPGAAMPACVENIHDSEVVHDASANSRVSNPEGQPPGGQADFAPESAEPQKTPGGLARWFGFAKSRARKLPHIVHVEIDNFFASIEQVLDPGLHGKPVLVGRAVVISASLEAKSRGVKTAMSFREALRICPKAIVITGQYEIYADFAERVRSILESYTTDVESGSMDDFYLNFAGAEGLYPDYEATLRRMQKEILGRTGLRISIGAGSSKVVAAIASRLPESRGFRVVHCGEEEPFLTPRPVENILGVGATLAERGIATIGELRRVPKLRLQAAFGEVTGQQIWEQARGLDRREALRPAAAKSISRETVLEGGATNPEFLGSVTAYLSKRIGSYLREHGRQARTIGLRVQYVDDFCADQAVRLVRATSDEREIVAAATDLLGKLFTLGVPVRLIRVTAAPFETDNAQLENGNKGRWNLNPRLDAVPEHHRAGQNGLFLRATCLSR